jgi:hypothetical protein
LAIEAEKMFFTSTTYAFSTLLQNLELPYNAKMGRKA